MPLSLRLRFILLPALIASCGNSIRPEPAHLAGSTWSPPQRLASIGNAPSSAQPPEQLIASITALVHNFNGKVGVAITRGDGAWTLANHGNELFPQQSVSKLWVAMTVLDAVDRGKLSLDDEIIVRESDRTLFNQPIMRLVGNEGYRSNIEDLLRFSLTLSDNTANDILLRKAGGPAAVRAFIERKRIGAVRFGPGERDLQAQTAGLIWQASYAKGNAFRAARAALAPAARQNAFDAYLADPIDGAAPVAIARALLRLKRGALLSPESTQTLLTLMSETKTGPERLKGGVPLGWQFAHKTGTGQDLGGVTAGYNDIALITAPDGTSYAVAVMIAPARGGIAARKALMQAVSSSVAAAHRPVVGKAASR